MAGLGVEPLIWRCHK